MANAREEAETLENNAQADVKVKQEKSERIVRLKVGYDKFRKVLITGV